MVRITDHGTPAVKGVRLEVPAGQVLCVSGPSGSGKSTLLRRINHLGSNGSRSSGRWSCAPGH
ncbi:ATP-binding cassette domain-containing protein [Streptomyces shenzhenensis]|uniref:ATP-binding cassette domain-containing protein n=1 Tax=Streptomyces shenzhenensis TaxID=943815 RepID=UPI003D8AC64A